MQHRGNAELLALGTILLVLLVICSIPIGCNAVHGAYGFGPVRTVTATVERTYEDSGKESSSYMVVTDGGVFEVDNGWLLGLWNADELYGQIKPGRRYEFTTKGNRVLGFWFQSYPYITAAKEVAVEQ